MLFSKKKKIDKEHPLVTKYKNVEDNINVLNGEISNYILKSLKEDIVYYVDNLKSGIVPHKSTYWYINAGCISNEFKLKKKELEIYVYCNGFFDKRFEITIIRVTNPDHIEMIVTDDLSDIVFQYIMESKISELNNKLSSTKKTFVSVESIVGRSLVRNSKIDDILK